ncbi:hypothetical protein TNCV_1122321 [Trichonephila clavipes]|nr:hypothetical protein TNCV_1122321 [Trichonephila clavipes]
MDQPPLHSGPSVVPECSLPIDIEIVDESLPMKSIEIYCDSLIKERGCDSPVVKDGDSQQSTTSQGEACLKRILSSFLVLRERDNRNSWRDGQVCPDVGQGIMAPLARRLGTGISVKAGSSFVPPAVASKRKTRERSPALDGGKGKSPALDRESMRGESWLERNGRKR